MARVGSYTIDSYRSSYSYVLISRYEDKVIDVKRCFMEFEDRTDEVVMDLLCRKYGLFIVALHKRYIIYYLTPEGMIKEKCTIECRINSYMAGFGFYILDTSLNSQIYDSYTNELICEIPHAERRICFNNKIFTQDVKDDDDSDDDDAKDADNSDNTNDDKIHVATIKDSKYIDQGYIDNPYPNYRIAQLGNSIVFRKRHDNDEQYHVNGMVLQKRQDDDYERYDIKIVNQSTLELIKDCEVEVGETVYNSDFLVTLDEEKKFDVRNGEMVKAGKFDFSDLIVPEHLSTISQVKQLLFEIYFDWPKDLIMLVLNYSFTNVLVDVC